MSVVFVNSAFVDVPERLVLRGGSWRRISLRVRYGVFLHPRLGPVLIDLGYGPRATQGAGRSLALRLYGAALAPRLTSDGAPDLALARLGFTTDDVRVAALTHLHADHVARIDQFARARVLARRSATESTLARSAFGRVRRGVFRELLPPDLDARIDDVDAAPLAPAPLGLPAGRDLLGDGSLLAIDLPGHADGHFGVCFPHETPPLLYAVDAQWTMRALMEDRAPGFPARAFAESGADWAASAAIARAFARAGGEVALCHEPALGPRDAAQAPG
jgi:glyoxylase-like metal-dependent hydrolase (beta-lactamase superfamily II)